jgi:hypothetical protein
MITMLMSLRWFLSKRPMCTLCGEKVRDLWLHQHVDHADGT